MVLLSNSDNFVLVVYYNLIRKCKNKWNLFQYFVLLYELVKEYIMHYLHKTRTSQYNPKRKITNIQTNKQTQRDF